MKKFILIIFIFVISIFGIFYMLFFTKIGNSTISKYIENSFNEKQNDFKLKFDTFIIDTNNINLVANINDSSKVKIDGKIKSLFDLKAEFIYKIDIKDLSIFNNIVEKELKGSLQANGDLITKNGLSTIIGTSNIANSSTKYEINLNKTDIKSLDLDIKNANIDELLALLSEPIYSFGKLNLNAKLIKNSSNFFNGDFLFDINDGKINNEIVQKEFNFPIKQTITYNLKSLNKLENTNVLSDIKLISSLANLDMKNLIIDLVTKDISSNYFLDILNLRQIEEFINIALNGDLKVAGNINKNQKTLKIDGNSNIADGVANFVLLDDNLDLKLKDANSLKLLYILNKDQFFNSNLSLDSNYNIISKIGNINIEVKNGNFIKNNFIQKIEDFTKIDLSKEIFESGAINSKIDNKKIYSNLNLISKKSDIKSKDSFIDFNKNIIDTKLDINLNKNIFSVKLEDDLNKPKIIVDVQDLIKNILEKKLDKYINKEDDAQKIELLKGIKSLF
ncbi:hypothetical protein [Aliarcobacter cryaerophilus]|uniref:hypothetical protein n=1 Tax=Aliarcobacter cryaerophilus TaxID=28198 RepID=UPI0021B578C1|nr:hypothetical protein [Aliarcobacter cryaerophilus]MCT7405833.1 hypothetical protein [Aliarcobacter cryaerophilus]MCT7503620.1 hypothetical protein [Aliarcobacter cryaerophilus]